MPDTRRGQEPARHAGDRLARLINNASAHLPAETLTQECALRRPADLLAAVCDYVGGPVALDDLVNTIAVLWNVREPAAADEDLARLPDAAVGALREMEGRKFLLKLWAEILQLPVRQRRALLLNLRDSGGGGCIALLPLTGVASLRQIAAALEMAAEQLAALWERLPFAAYSWQVTAAKNGQEVKAPRPPAPQAKFKVLDAGTAAELRTARQQQNVSHLALGVLYARAGMLAQAERELNALLRANPESEVARKLLADARAARRAR